MHKEIRLTSKRNRVSRLMDHKATYIKKEFANSEDYLREKEILETLKKADVKVPSIIKGEDKSLYLEDLGDMTLLQWYEEAEKQNTLDRAIIWKLCSWMKAFYEALLDHYKEPLVLYDPNFKNFLICGDQVYGIDFEQTRPGNMAEDAGKLSAFALTYDPPMTEWKRNFRNVLLDILSKELNVEKERILAEEKKELAAIKNRRGLEFKSL